MALLTSCWCTDLLLICLALVTAFYFYMTRNFNYWKKRGVEHIPPVPFFGNFFGPLTARRSLAEFFHDVYERGTDRVIGIHIFDQPCLVIRDPELVKRVLVKDFGNFSERTLASNEKHDALGTNNLFSIKNPLWKQMRVKLTPVFSSGRLKMMYPLINDVGTKLNRYVERIVGAGSSGRTTAEAKEVCAKYTTDVIASCAFGIEANALVDDDAEFRNLGRKIFRATYRRSLELMSFFFIPWAVQLFGFYFFEQSCSPILRNVLWSTMDQREKSGEKRHDLIDTLIKLKNHGTDDDGVNSGSNDNHHKESESKQPKLKFEGDTLVAQAAVFFTAGFETTGATMAFTLYELCLNQPLQAKLRREIRTVLDRHNGQLSYDSIAEMKLLHQCLLETLRLYPALPFLDRLCLNDYKIPDMDLVIEKGIPVYVPLFGLHRDPDNFEDPLRYDPDRFSDENRHDIKQFTYLPFGEGPHSCIGERFGSLQAKTGLVHILSEFEVDRCPETPVPLVIDKKALLVGPKNGIPMTFRRSIPVPA